MVFLSIFAVLYNSVSARSQNSVNLIRKMPVMAAPTGIPAKRATSQNTVGEPSIADEQTATKRARTLETNHTIDSDDEDGEDAQAKLKYDILNDDDVEGQEEGTLKVEEGVRITPFNIQDELEEGHFDTDGNFFVDKEKEIKDAWLDGLDQFASEDFEKLRKKKADEAAAEEASAPATQSDTELYKVIVTILRPAESIGKALRRLGAGIKPTQRVKKGAKPTGTADVAPPEVDPFKKEFDLLTSAADTILQKGNLEIYQETREKIQHQLSKAEARLASMKVDVEADIFGDDFNATKVTDAQSTKKANDRQGSPDHDNTSSQTAWEYKWLNTDSADVHGPYPSEQMLDWVQQDFFKDGVFVRKAGAIDAPFYSSKRVDFELYI